MSQNKGQQSVTLKHPIEIRAKDSGEIIETITEVTLSRVKGRHLKALDSVTGDYNQTLFLIAKMTGHPPSTIDEMDGEDITAIGEIIEGFFGKRRKTGKTSSAT